MRWRWPSLCRYEGVSPSRYRKQQHHGGCERARKPECYLTRVCATDGVGDAHAVDTDLVYGLIDGKEVHEICSRSEPGWGRHNYELVYYGADSDAKVLQLLLLILVSGCIRIIP